MKRFTLLVPAIALLALSAGRASATVVLSDNFDGYADQTAFVAAWPANTTTGTLTSATSVSAPNSVTFGLTAQRNARSIGEIGNVSPSLSVRFSFNFYDSNGAAAAYRQYAELDDSIAPSGSGQLLAIGLNNNLVSTKYMARILGGDGGSGVSAFFKLDGAGSPNRSTGWHALQVEISTNLTNSSNLDYNYYVDGILSKTLLNQVVTIRSFDYVKIGSNVTSTSTANFDDVLVETFTPVPEASSFFAVGMFALIGWYGKKRFAA